MDMNRRQILKAAALGAGAFALNPSMGSLSAASKYKLPKRFVFVVKSNGFYPNDITPKGVSFNSGSKVVKDLKGLELSPCLNALKKHHDQTTLIRGLSNKVAIGGHHGFYGALGCYPTPGAVKTTTTPPEATTFDCLLGKHLPSIYDNLGFFPETGNTLITPAYVSAIRANLPLPFYNSPLLTYKAIFGPVLSGSGKTEFDMKVNMMNNMIKNVNKFSKGLTGTEKEKLDRYVENYETLKIRDKKIFERKDVLKKYIPEIDDRYTPKKYDVTVGQKLHFEMASVALITGLTNVITIKTCNIGAKYEALGLKGANVHGIGHGSAAGTGSAQEARTRIRTHHCEMISDLADKLKAVPEAGGTMLDNTLIVYLSDGGVSHHGGCEETVRVLVGGKNIIKNEGKYIQYPGYGKSGHQTASSLYLAILHNIGKPQKTFGRVDSKLPDVDQTVPLAEFI